MSLLFTPIGCIDAGFPHLPDLMHEARIGRDGSRWFIVPDVELVPAAKKRTTGAWYKDEKDMRRACNGHRKFCAIVDAVRHLARGCSLEEACEAALGKRDLLTNRNGNVVDVGAHVRVLRAADWRSAWNMIANIGTPGYEPVQDAGSLPDL